MIIAVLIVLGLCFGSFVNALVYRLHEQSRDRKQKIKTRELAANADLSIMKGRSICVNCGHVLSAKDLVPVVSWLSLKGRCRYCQKSISWQYPAVEIATAVLFIISYLSWPFADGGSWNTESTVIFGFWLIFLIGFVALAVYDLKWYLLPNRIVYPLLAVALVQVAARSLISTDLGVILDALFGALIGGGLFYVLFQVSDGRWIGGGDVKLGFLLGLVLGSPELSFMMIFMASLIGSLVTVPLMLSKKASRDSHIPFGPFLIAGAIIVQLYGLRIVSWYQNMLIPIG